MVRFFIAVLATSLVASGAYAQVWSPPPQDRGVGGTSAATKSKGPSNTSNGARKAVKDSAYGTQENKVYVPYPMALPTQ